MLAKRGKMGVRGGEKFVVATPFRSLENAPFLANFPLKEATDQN